MRTKLYIGWVLIFMLLPGTALCEPFALEPFWTKAQELADTANLKPPILEKRQLDGAKLGKFDEARYAVYLDFDKISHLTEGSLAYFKTHELVHAAMFKKGIPSYKHHCLMGIQRIPVQIGTWILQHFYAVSQQNEQHPLIQEMNHIQQRYNRGCIGRL
ncbi:MAG: hypothetical protein OEU26_21200 [Candidatus Tectomicrobia bacterium]|nr:hypothetical protein [Candidatus Tectomicrobia bacterium]